VRAANPLRNQKVLRSAGISSILLGFRARQMKTSGFSGLSIRLLSRFQSAKVTKIFESRKIIGCELLLFKKNA
jgi:hypothetical protein